LAVEEEDEDEVGAESCGSFVESDLRFDRGWGRDDGGLALVDEGIDVGTGGGGICGVESEGDAMVGEIVV
jgi:hypothetical protein